MSNQDRIDFEWWLGILHGDDELAENKDAHGDYADPSISQAWRAWQGALAYEREICGTVSALRLQAKALRAERDAAIRINSQRPHVVLGLANEQMVTKSSRAESEEELLDAALYADEYYKFLMNCRHEEQLLSWYENGFRAGWKRARIGIGGVTDKVKS